MMRFEYVTNPKTGTIHVWDARAAHRTLCGQYVGLTWGFGDETASASAATCGRCRAIARSKARRACS